MSVKKWEALFEFIDEEFDTFFDDLVDKIMEQSDGEISKTEARNILTRWMKA
jgi:hypothetical protein